MFPRGNSPSRRPVTRGASGHGTDLRSNGCISHQLPTMTLRIKGGQLLIECGLGVDFDDDAAGRGKHTHRRAHRQARGLSHRFCEAHCKAVARGDDSSRNGGHWGVGFRAEPMMDHRLVILQDRNSVAARRSFGTTAWRSRTEAEVAQQRCGDEAAHNLCRQPRKPARGFDLQVAKPCSDSTAHAAMAVLVRFV